jgi:hypothetical protein
MKLKTKIVHSFDIETNVLDGFDFSFDVSVANIKKKRKIIIEKKKSRKIKDDASTRLF